MTSDGPPITPGLIHPGVTYSTPVGTDNFFNIDLGGGFTGGFLDGLFSSKPLTITFDNAQNGFGFDASPYSGTFNVTIKSASGVITSENFPSRLTFFGFGDTVQEITSVTIQSMSPAFGRPFCLKINEPSRREPVGYGSSHVSQTHRPRCVGAPRLHRLCDDLTDSRQANFAHVI